MYRCASWGYQQGEGGLVNLLVASVTFCKHMPSCFGQWSATCV